MGRSHQSGLPSRTTRVRGVIHPVWRGIGCILVFLIPIMAYAAATLVVQENVRRQWLPVTWELAQTVILPYIGPVPYLFSNLLVAGVFTLFGFGVLTLVYGLMYRVVGPPKYGPLDAPPEQYHRRKR